MWELLTRGAKPYDGIEPTRMRRYLKDGNRLQKPSTMTPDFVYVYNHLPGHLPGVAAPVRTCAVNLKFHWDQFPRNFPVANVTGKSPTSYEEDTSKLATFRRSRHQDGLATSPNST